MDNELIKFIVDLGSIGAICWIVYLFIKFTIEQSRLNSEERIESHKKYCDTILQLNETVEKTVAYFYDKVDDKGNGDGD